MGECPRAQSSTKGFTRIPTNSLDYRPRDYFGHYDLEAQLMTRVKGRANDAGSLWRSLARDCRWRW